MNLRELITKVLNGYGVLVGEVRAADVRDTGRVDKNSGLATPVWLINYFVELLRPGDFRHAKITRRVPRDVQAPAEYPTGVEKGRCYAFEVDQYEWKNGILMARMGTSEPALLDAGEGGPGVDAPQGAAMPGPAPSLVYLQTTPRTP